MEVHGVLEDGSELESGMELRSPPGKESENKDYVTEAAIEKMQPMNAASAWHAQEWPTGVLMRMRGRMEGWTERRGR